MPATEKTVRDIKKLHVVFACSSIVMFVSVIWMMYKDHQDEWRDYQKTALSIDVALARQRYDAINNEEYKAKKAELEKQIKEADQTLETQTDQIKEIESNIRDLAQQLDLLKRAQRFQNAERDVARANLDLAISRGESEEKQAELFATFEAAEALTQNTTREMEQVTEQLTAQRQQLGELTEVKDKLTEQLKQLQMDEQLASAALQKIAPENWFSRLKRKTMEWPIIDGFNSHLAVKQDWLPELHVTLGMTSTARFDRCRTCHVNVDRAVGSTPTFPHGIVKVKSDDPQEQVSAWVSNNKFPHPYSTHPRPEVYASASSPHPVETFGCTICHDGNGSGTSFQNAEHGPNDPWMAHEWKEDHHYHSNHFWEYPMQPARFVESGCIKCHHNVTELGINPKFGATAPKVYNGYKLIEQYGCFGCHEIHGYDAGEPIGPDLRLEPQTPEEYAKYASDETQFAGKMRKVGPSLSHIAQKTNEAWTQYWTEIPNRFRASTRMPQFFSLRDGGQYDEESAEYEPVELAAISRYLFDRSTDVDLDHPADGYQPDVERGKKFLIERGCMSCHTYAFDEADQIPKSTADFGPDLSRVHDKIRRDEGNPGFSSWLYTWLRNPELHHPRTKMPNLYLTVEGEGDSQVDPAADIVAFLLRKQAVSFSEIEVAPEAMKHLLEVYLKKALTESERNDLLSSGGRYPTPSGGEIKGDEIELFRFGTVDTIELLDAATNDAAAADATGPVIPRLTVTFQYELSELDPGGTMIWSTGDAKDQREQFEASSTGPKSMQITLTERSREAAEKLKPGDTFIVNSVVDDDMKMRYLGRRTISRYGCYGCHEIEGFATARPIGTALQDWGRKDTSKLALEHVEEWLHHHGEKDGTSTRDRAESAVRKARAGGLEAGEFKSEAEAESELSTAYFYDNLLHHGRPGFIWQKLRQPRSYDYEKVDTKGYDERLRMPMFPFNEDEIEQISTFVLGLVAEPPAEQYLYRPQGIEGDRIAGEQILAKYNCASCHLLDLPSIKLAFDTEEENFPPEGLKPEDYPESLDAIFKLRPPTGPTGETVTLTNFDGEPVEYPIYEAKGMAISNPTEDDFGTFELWHPMKHEGDQVYLPTERVFYGADKLIDSVPARGGDFAFWLTRRLAKTDIEAREAWNSVPPPLYQEGYKVQTPWLFQFLKNPYQLRHLTVLRMPRFNMSDEEARILANYFAAVTKTPYPYQEIPPRDAAYLALRERQTQSLLDAADQDAKTYPEAGWKLLNAHICVGCHAVGGRLPIAKPEDVAAAAAAGAAGAGGKPSVKRGPNLEYAADRLQPEWTLLWIRKPAWITPYTAMPVNFAHDKEQLKRLLDGKPEAQVTAIRDALFNYKHLLETLGPEVYKDPDLPATGAAPAAGNGGE